MMMASHDVFRELFSQSFPLETSGIQALSREITTLASSRELETAVNYFELKLGHAFLRLENCVLDALEASMVDTSRKQQGVVGQAFRDFWVSIHKPLDSKRMSLTAHQYIPRWQEEFFHNGNEIDRRQMVAGLSTTDDAIDIAAKIMQMGALMDVSELTAQLNVFLANRILVFHLKFAYLLLLARFDQSEITKVTSVLSLTQKIYLDGMPVWKDVVVEIVDSQVNPSGEDPLRYLANQPPPIIKTLNCTADVVRYQIEQLLCSSQTQKAQSSIHKLNQSLTQRSGRVLSALKREFNRDHKLLSAQSETLFIIAPDSATLQFAQEYRYAQAAFVNWLASILESCTVERRNHDTGVSITYQADNLEDKCLRLTTALDVFSEASISDLNRTWKEYLTTTCGQIDRNRELMRCVQLLGQYTQDRFLRHFESEMGLVFQDGLLELTALRRVHHDKLRARVPIDSEIEHNIRQEFERLLTDLKVQIGERQSTFGGIKRTVIDSIAARIEAAKSVTLEMNPNESYHTRGAISDWNRDLFSELKSENLGLSQLLTKMRILRCLGEISTVRAYKKRLAAAENDRKQTHTLFWSNRLTYESAESGVETQLVTSRKRLAETEIEIERVKQQLEIEKANNSQLVTWKAKNLRTVDMLREQLETFASIGDVNVAQLLQQLSARHAELDELMEDADEFEELVHQGVHRQLGELSRVRERIQSTRRAKSELLEFLNARPVDDIRHSYDLSEVKVDNRQLRRTNQALAEEIQNLENQKDRRPAMVRRFMEATVAPPVPVIRSRARPPGIIIRPLVPGHPLGKMLQSS
jgi:hypothetical protein